MAQAAEDMTLEDLAAACDPYMCRALPVPVALAPNPLAAWNHINFLIFEIEGLDCNPLVHYLDVVTNYQLDVAFADLEIKYRTAILNKDLQLLPAPFGLRAKVASDVRIQFALLENADGADTIFKHFIFPQKCKASVMKTLAYGTVSKPNYMQAKPTVGRKISQCCVQNMGGRQPML